MVVHVRGICMPFVTCPILHFSLWSLHSSRYNAALVEARRLCWLWLADISTDTHTHTQIYSVWMYLACCPFVGRDHLYSLSHTQRIISPTLSKFDTVNASDFIGAAVSHLFPPSPVFFTVFCDAGIQNWLLCLNSTKGVEIFDIILLFVLKLFQFKDNLNPFPLPCWCTALLARSRKLHLVPMLSFNW